MRTQRVEIERNAMLPVPVATLRDSFVNASKKELTDLNLPAGFDSTRWADLDYLGWRDPKNNRRAYVIVADGHDGFRGILLRQAEASPRSRAQCSWCEDVTLPNDVVFYSAKKAGAAGRRGDTIGTLVCQDFQCSANVRKNPPLAYTGFDLDAARQARIEVLRVRSASFAHALGS